MASKINNSKSKKDDLIDSVQSYLAMFFINEKDEVRAQKILDAMNIVDRKAFVNNPGFAYQDSALPVGEGQTISQPSTVARMLFLADLKKKDNVLEVGSASGWNACISSVLTYPGRVVSIDLIPSMMDKALNNKEKLKKILKKKDNKIIKMVDSIEFRVENLFDLARNPIEAFDKIIITAGITLTQEEDIKDIAIKMLKSPGILICPFISGPMLIMKKIDGDIVKDYTGEDYAFVPLLDDLM